MQESWTGPVDAPLQCLVWIPPCPWILTYSGVRPKLLLHEKKMITRAVDRGSWSGSSSQSCMSKYLGSSGMGWWPGIEVYGRELLQSLASTSNTPPPDTKLSLNLSFWDTFEKTATGNTVCLWRSTWQYRWSFGRCRRSSQYYNIILISPH